jgi:hypothetical protein
MVMDEKDLERQLAELREDWRIAPEPPLDRMWLRIEGEAFGRRGPGRWLRTLLPLAATLVLGFGIGQVVPPLLRHRDGRPTSAVATERAAPDEHPTARLAGNGAPFVGVATDYLERVTALLVTLAEESRQGQPVDYSKAQARELLSTTRLLMNGPQVTDPHLRELLDDLELVLAQIVRLPPRPGAPDVYLIDQALDQREVIPRLRVMLAENPTSSP